jgi:hypothetical protein
MSEVTRILSAIEQGEPHAAAQLLPDHTQVVAAGYHVSARQSETRHMDLSSKAGFASALRPDTPKQVQANHPSSPSA